MVTVVGLGLTPFTGGFSLGLTALGGAMVIGGANSFINHASWAATGRELNLIGNASGAVGRWYDVHVARPAAGSGNWGRQFLAGLGGGAIDMVSGTLQLNVKEIGVGLGTLATSGQARERLWAGVSGFAGKLGQGDAFAWGQLTANLVPFAGGAAKLVKAGGAGGVAGVLSRVKGGVVSSAQDMKAVLGGAKSVFVSTVHDAKSVLTSVKSGLGGVRDRFLAGINDLAERTNQFGPGVRLATAGAGVPAGAWGGRLKMMADVPKGHPRGGGGVGGGGVGVPKVEVVNPFDPAREGALLPNVRFRASAPGTRHQYVYETNAEGLIERVRVDRLHLKPKRPRFKNAGDTPGKLPGDEAGHLIADMFDGSPELDNLVSQNWRLNRGAGSRWKAMERDWQDALTEVPPKAVTNIEIRVIYDESKRPIRFDVDYVLDGKQLFKTFQNSLPEIN